jgi:hypothetical protein
LSGEILGSHTGLVHGYKEAGLKGENLMEHAYTAAQLIDGKDISCISFTNMMELEGDLLKRSRTFEQILQHAREIKHNHEAVYDLSGPQASAQAAE